MTATLMDMHKLYQAMCDDLARRMEVDQPPPQPWRLIRRLRFRRQEREFWSLAYDAATLRSQMERLLKTRDKVEALWDHHHPHSDR